MLLRVSSLLWVVAPPPAASRRRAARIHPAGDDKLRLFDLLLESHRPGIIGIDFLHSGRKRVSDHVHFDAFAEAHSINDKIAVINATNEIRCSFFFSSFNFIAVSATVVVSVFCLICVNL